jgi:predicted lipoprotein with Yx(FWY)xxD motif
MKKTLLCGILAIAGMGFVSSAVLAAEPPVKTENGMLVDSKGMTLYTFDKDKETSGKSACSGQCAENWPPLMATAEDKKSGDYDVIKRDGDQSQWTYKGQPLYLFKKDTKPGDMTGDGVKDVWHVIKP